MTKQNRHLGRNGVGQYESLIAPKVEGQIFSDIIIKGMSRRVVAKKYRLSPSVISAIMVRARELHHEIETMAPARAAALIERQVIIKDQVLALCRRDLKAGKKISARRIKPEVDNALKAHKSRIIFPTASPGAINKVIDKFIENGGLPPRTRRGPKPHPLTGWPFNDIRQLKKANPDMTNARLIDVVYKCHRLEGKPRLTISKLQSCMRRLRDAGMLPSYRGPRKKKKSKPKRIRRR